MRVNAAMKAGRCMMALASLTKRVAVSLEVVRSACGVPWLHNTPNVQTIVIVRHRPPRQMAPTRRDAYRLSCCCRSLPAWRDAAPRRGRGTGHLQSRRPPRLIRRTVASGVDFPMRDQQRACLGIEESASQPRQRLCVGSGCARRVCRPRESPSRRRA